MEVRLIHFIGFLIILLVLLRISFKTRENFQDIPPDATFTLYYSDTCPISQQVKSTFMELMKLSPIMYGTKKIIIQMADPDKESLKVPSGFTLNDYPTILFIGPKGGITEYMGENTLEKYKEFLNQRFDPNNTDNPCYGLDSAGWENWFPYEVGSKVCRNITNELFCPYQWARYIASSADVTNYKVFDFKVCDNLPKKIDIDPDKCPNYISWWGGTQYVNQNPWATYDNGYFTGPDGTLKYWGPFQGPGERNMRDYSVCKNIPSSPHYRYFDTTTPKCTNCDCIKAAYKAKNGIDHPYPDNLIQCYRAKANNPPTFIKDPTGFWNI